MSIALDHRTGSGELAPLFAQYGIKPDVRRLEFGDMAFEGNGPNGRCAITVERKRIEDLVQSITSKRLSGHQLPGMADQYDYCYLLVEGIWRPGPSGELQIAHGSVEADRFGGRWLPSHGRGIGYRNVDNYLSTLELHAGVIYRRTLGPHETVAMVVDLYRWWDKAWAEHSSHIAVYAPAVPTVGRGRIELARRAVPLAEAWAMQLQGVQDKAQAVAQHFGSARAMANATAADWIEVKGVGKVIARRAVEAINEQIPGAAGGHGA